MRALLLAAGMGTRLRPITNSIPKCLVPIHGRPLIDYWFDLLFRQGRIERALVNTHHLSERVTDHVARSVWRDRVDLVHEPTLLGTGGTLKANRHYYDGEDVLVCHADNLTDLDVEWFVSAHEARPRNAAMTMLAFRTSDPESCGILALDEEGIVQEFHEKVSDPPGNLANGAVYLCTPEIVDAAEQILNPVVDLSTEIIPRFVGRIYAVETSGYHRDIGTAESLRLAQQEFPRPAGAIATH